jgi:O-antigen/teichoic acid export membrane protein
VTVALFLYSVLADGALARVIGAFVLAAPLCLIREFGRRYLFAHMQVARVVAMTIAASSAQLIAVGLFAYAGYLSACTALLAMGFGSGLAILGWLRLNLHAFRFDESFSREFLLKSWGLGRWIFASETTAVVSANVMPWLIVFLIGPAATGIFAACDSILRFTNPVIISMTNVFTSKVSLDYSNNGKAAVRRNVRNASAFLIVFQCAFCILLVVAGEPILKRSFGDAFATYWPVLAVLGLNQLVAKLALAPGRALMLVDRVNVFLWAEIAGLAISLVAAIALAPRYGVLGAALSLVAGNVLLTAWTVSAYFAVMRDDKEAGPILISTSSATPAAARSIAE